VKEEKVIHSVSKILNCTVVWRMLLVLCQEDQLRMSSRKELGF
jgi:hypothetical protein